MVMSEVEALAQARQMNEQQAQERGNLDALRKYWQGRQALPAIVPPNAPNEVRVMARMSRVNVIKIVVESITQSMIVDNLRAVDQAENPVIDRAWAIWQVNGMDRRQFGLTRATTAYGTGYEVVLPGRPVPVVRPVSPRAMTTRYGDDDMWPVFAWERRAGGWWRLYDSEAVYEFASDRAGELVFVGSKMHDAQVDGRRVTPVVRFVDVEDLDADDEPAADIPLALQGSQRPDWVPGQVAPLVDLQDQINMTSFALRAAEWYSAFRQRWIKGKALSAGERQQAGASTLWTFDEDPDSIALGEFSQTDLRGYIESRAEAMKFAATLSQTPVHELIGELVNLSAEALAAAEIGRDRMVGERRTSAGESHEQALRLAVAYEGAVLPDNAEVIWRDTSARAFGAVVDGLGKIAQMLQVPPQELWEKIPGATKQDVERWRAAFEQGDALTQMTDMLDRQAGGGAPAGGERTTASGLIVPSGVA